MVWLVKCRLEVYLRKGRPGQLDVCKDEKGYECMYWHVLRVAVDGVFDWRLSLLTTLTHNSGLLLIIEITIPQTKFFQSALSLQSLPGNGCVYLNIKNLIYFLFLCRYAVTGLHATLYRVSQEGCAILREGVPYVKIYRYNPKHLCPNLNGYGDNGQRKVWSSVCSTYYTYQLRSYLFVLDCGLRYSISAVFVAPAVPVSYFI
jgi:hypothetical protein